MNRLMKMKQKLLRLVQSVFHCVRTRSIKAVFKKHWHKFLSVVCASSFAYITLWSNSHFAFANSMSDVNDTLKDIIDGELTGDDYVDVVSGLFQAYTGGYPGIAEAFSRAYRARQNSDLLTDPSLLNPQPVKEDPKSFQLFFEDWANSVSDDSNLYSVKDGDFTYYLYKNDLLNGGELPSSEWNYYKSDDWTILTKKDGNNGLNLSAGTYKDVVSDYNSRYAPMPTQSMWKWSYQTELSYKPAKSATPYIPIYWSNYGAWGGKDGNWKECYVLPFLTDDNVSAPYYMNYYYHFYPSYDDDHTPYINVELYSLMDNQVYTSDSWKFAFRTGTYEGKNSVFALNLLGYRNAPFLYGYTSDVGYLTSTTDSSMFTYNQISRNSGGYSFSGGALSNLTLNKDLYNLISESTFTPDTSIGDDWGAYISQTPFQLWGNQKTVDWDRVPDNYYITIEGDNFYDYTITDPDSGKNSSFGDFLIDYNIPDLEDPDEDDNSGGSGGGTGKVDVSGTVKVDGKIEIKTDPVDINVNVNTSSGAGDSLGDYVNSTAEASAGQYIGMIPEVSKGFFDYLSDFMAWLPPEIKGLVILGLIVAIWCRLHGR